MKINAKLRKTLNTLSRIIIVAMACWFIYRQVFASGDYALFKQQFGDNLRSTDFLLLLGIAFLLMPLNWVIEAAKWKMLISYIEYVSLSDALKSVFTGITFSLFTPNRIGDFLGRIFTLKRANRVKSSLLTFAGSISQLLVTLVTGLIALLFFLPKYTELSETWLIYLYLGLIIISLFLGTLMIMMFLRAPIITRKLYKMVKPKWRRINLYIIVIERIRRRTLINVLLMSMLRYLIFSGQFYLLLRAFGLHIPYFQALILISMTYFVMAAIPTIALADLGIRGSVSIYFIGLFSGGSIVSSTEILSASTLIWTINLAIPALLGIFFIHRLSFIKKPEPNDL
jgi:hypothetical protein